MPMFIPVRGAAATGDSYLRDFSSWFSQVQRQQPLNIETIPVMLEPPITTLTKATGMAAAMISGAGTGYSVGR
ncbi:Uncharacterised protein [Citrobacter freundii]|nr:Uncharacterised protein [Citrobacter freundii]